jgi:ABC-type multidrug transport system fused ATPase/permease subunit
MELKDTGRRILAYGKPHWKKFAASFLFFTLGAAVEPAIPALFKKLIDSGFKEGLNYPLWIVPIIIVGLFAIRGAFNFAGNYTMTSGTSSVVLDLRRHLMRALLTRRRASSSAQHQPRPRRHQDHQRPADRLADPRQLDDLGHRRTRCR